MIQPSLTGLVPSVQGNPALASAQDQPRRTVLGYFQPSLRDSIFLKGKGLERGPRPTTADFSSHDELRYFQRQDLR